MLVKRLAAYTHLSSTISEIYQVIGRKLPAGGEPVGISRRSCIHTKLELMGYRVMKKA